MLVDAAIVLVVLALSTETSSSLLSLEAGEGNFSERMRHESLSGEKSH
jgi:hypothetical protein